ncbi:hypothetical protein Q8F55_005831 [Vanrija albida]|uniref:Major facilitator superfamily (MFS) profile domain-containing protein n=1 Tax=Vanrija albida TaxID=181172 RepID=A0ABR3Q395_9TREE
MASLEPEKTRVETTQHEPKVDYPSASSSEETLVGVNKVQAANSVGPKTKWVLYISIGLAAYIYSLDGTTTWQYLVYATSSFFEHSFSGTIDTAGAIIIAIGKPLMAKLADVIGRAETFIIVGVLYAVGYAMIAGAKNVGTIAGGMIIYRFGYTGLQILQQVLIADITTLRWRGIMSALVSAPFIINAFVSAEIAESILPAPDAQGLRPAGDESWRWGYGMFAIMVPVILIPICGSLLWAQHKARKERRYLRDESSAGTKVKRALIDMDIGGLFLILASLGLILIPLGLAPKAVRQWKTPSMIAMITVGAVMFPVFLLYEFFVPKRPVFPMRWLLRMPILGACLIGFFDFVSFYLQYQFLFSFMTVTQPTWSNRVLNYFMQTQTVALTVFGILAGVIMAATRRFKWMLIIGLLIRLLGVGLMLHARSPSGNVASLVMCQVLQGIGGGFAAISTQVGAQAAVSHVDVATVTAMVLLLTEIGNGVGTAAATTIWTEYMPRALAEHVPGNNATLNAQLFGSITTIMTYPLDDPIRVGAIEAYRSVMHRLVLGALIVAIFPPIFAFIFMKDIRLGDTQNAVDGKNLAGEQVEDGQLGHHGEAVVPLSGGRERKVSVAGV